MLWLPLMCLPSGALLLWTLSDRQPYWQELLVHSTALAICLPAAAAAQQKPPPAHQDVSHFGLSNATLTYQPAANRSTPFIEHFILFALVSKPRRADLLCRPSAK